MTMLAIWAALAVLAAMFVASLGRSGLREEQARDRVPAGTTPGAAAEPVLSRPGHRAEGCDGHPPSVARLVADASS